jgi:hypothetical protein
MQALATARTITAAAAVAAVVAVLVPLNAAPGRAAPRADGSVYCNPITNKCRVTVDIPGRPGVSGGTGQGTGSRDTGRESGGATSVADTRPSRSDLCTFEPAQPQPAASDPIWAGHEPGSGTVYVRTCPYTRDTQPVSTFVFVPNGEDPATAAPVVTPAELAQRAMATLRVPRPVVERSPDERNRTASGVSYTWVHEWTWFWASPRVWRPVQETARAGDVWATVTVTPTRLVVNPGIGDGVVSCPGPGRAWTSVDGDAPPSRGGCGYMYRDVTAQPVRVRASIEWSVTWEGSGGSGGTLPVMRTSASSPLVVQQIQVVTR